MMGRRGMVVLMSVLWLATGPESVVLEDDITRNRPIDEEHRNQTLDDMEGQPAPSVDSEDWMNTEPLDWAHLRGKVVLLDFWGVWCKPCVRAIPELRKLYDVHQENGLVVIGVHTDESSRRGKNFVANEGIEYPIVFDRDDVIAERFRVNHYPSYYLVDRHGRLRMADIVGVEIDDAIEFLLDEEYTDE